MLPGGCGIASPVARLRKGFASYGVFNTGDYPVLDYGFTEEQQMIFDLAKQIADEKIRPVAAELDEKQEFPEELVPVFGESGICGVYIDEAYGGCANGTPIMNMVIAAEQLSKA
ncbi:MAG: acyl-CoA dehydrogenase family protein, partial [Planctomycetes bacterium]|nr:acyl-CoA dehydrogenase family protein [Planctomycetota bacterium]